MVALQQGEDYGTSQFVSEQIQQRGPQRRPAIYTTLRIVIDANAGTVERHLEARDGELREQFALSNRFENPAAAISFYAALGFKINRKRSKGGRIVLEANAVHTQARTFDGREPDFTPGSLPQKRVQPAPAPKAKAQPVVKLCQREGCTEPCAKGRKFCAAHLPAPVARSPRQRRTTCKECGQPRVPGLSHARCTNCYATYRQAKRQAKRGVVQS